MSDIEDVQQPVEVVEEQPEETVEESREVEDEIPASPPVEAEESQEEEQAMSYSSRYGSSYGSSYSSPCYDRSDSRRDSNYSSSGGYRRDSGASRYGDYGSSRFVTSRDRSFDYTAKYTDPDRFSKYRQPSVNEKSYDTEPSSVVAPEAEEDHHEPVVLQESDVDHFSPSVEESAENILEYEQEHLQHESDSVHEHEESAREPTPEPPVYVTEATIRRESVSSPNENNNPEILISPKKLGGGVWPPQDDASQKLGGIPEDTGVGKKRVSDLIARFNAGNVENDGQSKTDSAYKQAYGASGRNGKVQQSVFH